jgi:8-oxo-dGTP pyrophosphatase MutT (NUDIX family)
MGFTSYFPKSFQHYKPRSHKVFGVICETGEKKYLLVRGKRSGKWSFPKGHMEGKESALECALRELYEETGVRLEGRTYASSVKLSRNTEGKNSEYFVFKIEHEIPASVNDRNEIIEVGWFSIEDMRNMPCNIDVSSFHMRSGMGAT